MQGQFNDRLIFNGHDLSELVMCRFERPIMPQNVNTTQEIGGRHGAIFRSNRLGTRIQPVTMWLRTEKRREVSGLRHRLAKLLYTDEPAPLVLPDEPELFYLAILDGDTNLGEIVNDKLPVATVNFLICDPIAYGREVEKSITGGVDLTVNSGGTWQSYPYFTGIPYQNSLGELYVSCKYENGDVKTVRATADGNDIDYFSRVRTYYFDMENERLFDSTGKEYGVTLESDFFTLDGACTISGNVTGAIKWRERWL